MTKTIEIDLPVVFDWVADEIEKNKGEIELADFLNDINSKWPDFNGMTDVETEQVVIAWQYGFETDSEQEVSPAEVRQELLKVEDNNSTQNLCRQDLFSIHGCSKEELPGILKDYEKAKKELSKLQEAAFKHFND